ncbi:SGNH/GDSL hydrolase family protein [Aurantibacter crassamenti]|uniref:SGNH/GDSL hydrolase family protein n=1 Tax=Aurantibacter crassamenti TaxID=1837375 RepID=UPI0019394AC0|nr:SGNH/GDSL hydrolase family protein [Aurantibacter crassamenti]MBM1107541.1 SGNH/GDSL hydrolase family protein [Aurantibacter crassamenti]
MRTILALLFCFQLSILTAQDSIIKWWNPVTNEFPVIEGQAWPNEVETPYDRLPARAEKTVRKAVWNLSKHSAGLKIRFRSNAEEIIVRYKVRQKKAMDHMPATGVSGVDLYAITSDGATLWANGKREFSDTITYRFGGLQPNDRYHELGREYRLDLPLYNSVEWMEIGVPTNTRFEALPVRKEKPIVVYGTSIAHGACASRPGMAWTSILGRNLDRPVLNLAFSGNGRLEKELIDLLVEIEAKIYILDCLPNLTREKQFSDIEIENRIINSVNQLRQERPDTPILLTEHAGYSDGYINPERMKSYTRVNTIQKNTFDKLINKGITNLHYLSYDELGLQLDDTVDGTHPNDLGMMHYAEAYETKLREILQEPLGKSTTTLPVTQLREPYKYDWEKRHRQILEMNKTNPPKKVILANSIIHFWGGLPKSEHATEEKSWDNYFTPLGLGNYAYGWDRLENVLWRIYHGELDGFKAEQVLGMISTNNLHLNTNEEIIEGHKLILQAIQNRQPQADIIWFGILPRRDNEERVVQLNTKIKETALNFKVKYADVGAIFLKEDNTIDESLFSDGLHPNKAGYKKMRKALMPYLKE